MSRWPGTPDPTSAPRRAPHLAYRRDIDGLRAVAVVAVVIFHFGMPGTGGGFVGVDIFFVISGFLITSILAADIEGDRFSLLRFYERRVRRIAPALFTVLIASGLVALVVLPPRALKDLAQSVIATIVFVSNIYFWSSTQGYFNGAAEIRPLLHTWSLGVEEQFYIVFPIILAATMRWGRNRAAWIVLAGLVAAFAASAWITPRAPSASFYLSPTRAWELLTGALMALRPTYPAKRWVGEAASLLGFGLVAFSVATFSVQTLTPGFAAIAPCLGAALLIIAGGGPYTPVVNSVLASRPFVALGLISYSLYLWHWPIYVYLRHYILFAPLGADAAAGGATLAVLLATLSWRFIEQPIRRRDILKRRGILFAAFAGAALIIAALSGGVLLAKGLPERFHNLSKAAMQTEALHPEWAPYDSAKCFVLVPANWGGEACRLTHGKPGGHQVLLWGDSYAGHYANGFLAARDQLPISVLEYTSPRCPPIADYYSYSDPDCAAFNRQAIDVIRRYHIDTVILSARWESYMSGHRMTGAEVAGEVKALRAWGLTVILVGQSPVFNFDYPDDYYLARLRAGEGRSDDRASLAFPATLNNELRAAAAGATFFDPSAVLCEGQRCLYRKSGQYIVGDSGHFTQFGSSLMVAELAKLPPLQ